MNKMDEDIFSEFYSEATEIVERLYGDLDLLPTSDNKAELVQAIYRGVHTIKGTTGMIGFGNMEAVAHKLESRLGALRSTPELISESDIQLIRVGISKIEELLKNGDKAEEDQAPVLEQPKPREPEAKVQKQRETSTAPAPEDHVRVPVKKLNETLNAISEIFLVRNQMVYLVERFKSGVHNQRDFLRAWELLDSTLRRGIGDVERSAMSMRMTTVQGLFQRMNRVIQAYVGESGKRIQVRTSGEETELDKKVIDILGEPLIHLIRNCMDHGIEEPAARLAREKPETGTISLNASISGNEIVLQISDDGKGIDGARVLASAKSKGIDVSGIKDEQAAIELIFLPGFSTAEKVTSISGRGVGMDAVRSSISGLGGRITVTTKVGQGTTFSIRIPTIMSMVAAILVDINGFKYSIPNHEVLETRTVPSNTLRVNAGSHYVSFRDGFIPCVDLRGLLNRVPGEYEENTRDACLVIFRTEYGPAAARVSSFEKNTEIIVKPSPKLAPKFPYVNGVSVLPTGEPIFIMSLARIFDWSRGNLIPPFSGEMKHDTAA